MGQDWKGSEPPGIPSGSCGGIQLLAPKPSRALWWLPVSPAGRAGSGSLVLLPGPSGWLGLSREFLLLAGL